MKSLWVVSRDVGGSLRVQGRQSDGPGVVAFQDGIDEVPTDPLVIPDPGRRSVMPGGAPREVMRSYAFIPTYLIYPSPGCWELTARLSGKEIKIVLELKSLFLIP